MFHIKICGITRRADAIEAWRAGADAVGLNLYDRSPRYVRQEEAVEWIGQLPAGLLRVGVFVNAERPYIERCVERLGLDAVQLHGDEPPEALAELPWPVIRAVRIGGGDVRRIAAYLDRCWALGVRPAAILVDAPVAGQYGGTGERADWAAAAQLRDLAGASRLILAGGLTAENVAGGIQAVRPDGVDVASGVERSPGIKDPEKVRAFVRQAQEALARC